AAKIYSFRDSQSAKDLWNACKQYGHVVDAFIPNKRSKDGKTHWVRAIEILGWTPDLDDQNDEESDSEDEECEEVFKKDFGESGEEVQGEVNVSRVFNTYEKAGGESMDSDHCREFEGSRKGDSILMLMDELVKVGQTMGYNMDGCMKNIESQGVDGVFQ
ncbi:hypothetical protein Tco_0847920, partial [Tanacetum coccineum]